MEILASGHRGPQGRGYGAIQIDWCENRAVVLRKVSGGSKHAKYKLWLICGWAIPGPLPGKWGRVQIEPIITAEDRNRIRVQLSMSAKGIMIFLVPK